jgi:hypothetical protein
MNWPTNCCTTDRSASSCPKQCGRRKRNRSRMWSVEPSGWNVPLERPTTFSSGPDPNKHCSHQNSANHWQSAAPRGGGSRSGSRFGNESEPACTRQPSLGTGSRPSLVRTLVKSVPAGASVHCCPARQPISRNALASGLNAKRREKTDVPHHPPTADAPAPVPNKDDPRRPNVKRLLGPVHGRTLRCPTLRTSVQVFTCSVHVFSQKSPRLRCENTGFC